MKFLKIINKFKNNANFIKISLININPLINKKMNSYIISKCKYIHSHSNQILNLTINHYCKIKTNNIYKIYNSLNYSNNHIIINILQIQKNNNNKNYKTTIIIIIIIIDISQKNKKNHKKKNKIIKLIVNKKFIKLNNNIY